MVEQNWYEVYMVNLQTEMSNKITWANKMNSKATIKIEIYTQINECDFNMEDVLSIAKPARGLVFLRMTKVAKEWGLNKSQLIHLLNQQKQNEAI